MTINTTLQPTVHVHVGRLRSKSDDMNARKARSKAEKTQL
jgi:hypothetical protein